jgi:hypothetical protein
MTRLRGPFAESLVRSGIVLGLVCGTAAAFFGARDLVWNLLEARTPVASPAMPAPLLTTPAAGAAVGCAASNCHGHAVPVGPELHPTETWRWAATLVVRDSDPDPHGNAFQVLTEPASIEMMRKLNAHLPAKDRIPAEANARCLACHSNPAAAISAAAREAGEGFNEERFTQRTDGISCDTCHQDDARGQWRREHVSWNAETDRGERYQSLGLPFLNDLHARGRLCAGCHVGSSGIEGTSVRREVDHDLIAAGHPPLGFELLGSTRRLPRHWFEKDRQLNPRDNSSSDRMLATWAAGQNAVLRASLDLMEKGAKADAVWPEFAQTRCFDCHDGMVRGGRTALLIRGKQGSSIWRRGLELRSLFDASPEPVEAFLQQWSRLSPDEASVRQLIPAVRSEVTKSPASINTIRMTIERVQSEKDRLSRLNWDEAAWLRGALAAVEVSRQSSGGEADPEIEAAFEQLDEALRVDLPHDPDFHGIVTPRRYEPEQTGRILTDLIRELQSVDSRLTPQ